MLEGDPKIFEAALGPGGAVIKGGEIDRGAAESRRRHGLDMQHPSGKPTDPAMRFFSRDLIARFGSADDDVADRADEEWEIALRDYAANLDRLRPAMPESVAQLAGLHLHDATILAAEEGSESPLKGGWFVLTARRGAAITSLFYALRGPVRRHSPAEGWPASGGPTLWLHEEVDEQASNPGAFVHRILLSDGVVVEVPFASVLIHRYALSDEAPRLTA